MKNSRTEPDPLVLQGKLLLLETISKELSRLNVEGNSTEQYNTPKLLEDIGLAIQNDVTRYMVRRVALAYDHGKYYQEIDRIVGGHGDDLKSIGDQIKGGVPLPMLLDRFDMIVDAEDINNPNYQYLGELTVGIDTLGQVLNAQDIKYTGEDKARYEEYLGNLLANRVGDIDKGANVVGKAYTIYEPLARMAFGVNSDAYKKTRARIDQTIHGSGAAGVWYDALNSNDEATQLKAVEQLLRGPIDWRTRVVLGKVVEETSNNKARWEIWDSTEGNKDIIRSSIRGT